MIPASIALSGLIAGFTGGWKFSDARTQEIAELRTEIRAVEIDLTSRMATKIDVDRLAVKIETMTIAVATLTTTMEVRNAIDKERRGQ